MNAQSQTKPDATVAVAPVAKPKSSRRMLMLSLPVLIVVGAAVYWVNGGRYEVTDDAYLHQARIAIASDLGGRIVAVGVVDGQAVQRGDVMFQVDPEPYRLALIQADTAVAAARLQVEQLKVGYQAALAQQTLAGDDATYAADQLDKQQALSSKGVQTATALDEARNVARRAKEQAALSAIAVMNAKALLGGNPQIATDAHPAVAAAMAAQEQARYRLQLTRVEAPADGVVYQATSFKPGQMVAAGQAIFTLLETADVWVDANFKETQLSHIAAGQAVEVSFDVASGVKVAGHVDTIGSGTGSEFSLLPAQNATGNWVKVTQRVPVRVRLDQPGDVALIVSGMSAKVSVDTGQSRSLSDLLPSFLTGK